MRDIRLMWLVSFAVYAANGTASPLLSLYLQSLGASFAQIALILTAMGIAGLLCNMLWGRYADRLGRRKPLLAAGLAGMALCYWLLSQAHDPLLAGVIRVGEGISLAAYTTGSLTLMGDLLQEYQARGRQMGNWRGVGSLAFAFGSLTAGRLADATSSATVLAGCGGLYLLGTVLVLLIREHPHVREQALPAPEVVDRAATIPKLVRLPSLFIAGTILYATMMAAAYSLWPNYMASVGYSKTAISQFWALAAVSEVPWMGVVGHLSDLIGRAPLMAAGGVGIAMVLLSYLAFAGTIPALGLTQIFRGFAYSSYTASSMTYVTEIGNPGARGRRSGSFNSTSAIGSVLGSALGGTLVQLSGFNLLFGTCALLGLCAAVCFWRLRQIRVGPSVELPLPSHK